MNQKKKITIIAAFAAIIVIAGIGAALLNARQTQEGIKHFQVEVISERDGYSQITECESTEEYLGLFMRTFEGCEWQDSEYGTYITGFDGMQEDLDNQYWWCITVNDETNNLGADQVPLEEGSKYTFTLVQGW